MTISNPNTTLLQAKDQFPSDKTPAPLTGPKNAVTFQVAKVGPPSALYLQRDDVLTIEMFTALPGGTGVITGRMLRPDTGDIVPFQYSLPLAVTYGANVLNITLDEGFLLSLVVTANVGSFQGQVWVTAVLNRAAGIATFGVPGQILLRDYLTGNAPATWPNGRMTLPTEGPGAPKVVTIANPGAGADWTQAVQNAAIWELVAFNAVLTTAVAVANRQPQLILDDAVTTFFIGDGNVNIPASTVANVSGAQLTPNTGILATDVSLPIPPRIFLPGGFRIRTSTVNIQAADQWSAIRLFVREWLQM